MKKIITFLVLGMIGAVAALFLEIIFSLAFPEKVITIDYFQKFTPFLLLVAIIEEFFKVSLLQKGLSLASEKELPRMGIFLGLGFGMSELIVRNSYGQGDFSLGQLSALLVHILTASLAGYILSRKNTPDLWQAALAFLSALIIHLAYNLSIIYLFAE